MKLLEDIVYKIKPHFEEKGKLSQFYYLFDAIETFIFVKPDRTHTGAHIRDPLDMKRMMVTVVLALMPCFLFGTYNAGYQKLLAAGTLNPDLMSCVIQGLILVLPLMIVVYTVGGIIEGVFAVVRHHEINEGFLVTGMLITLIMPPTLPLWQAAVGTAFGILIGKEVFGGTGMNILNPALTARAFVFFAYPVQLSGDKVWVASSGSAPVTMATPLANAADTSLEMTTSLSDLFWGFIPGSIGETSAFACLIGAAILIISGVGSWRTMLGMVLGGIAMIFVFHQFPQALSSNHIFSASILEHLCMGGFAFGAIFMATDPVSSANTNKGKWIFGFCAGLLAMTIRSINPAYPEGTMLAILFMNVFAPLIDYYVVESNKKRRAARAA